MKHLAIALFLVGLSATATQAIDMHDLEPCRGAAARYCDRSGGMNFSNLVRCGAALAAHSFRVGNGCREVLKRYGQI
jgi:hypothetical protein